MSIKSIQDEVFGKCCNCQFSLPAEAAFCPECGTAVGTAKISQAGLQTIGGMSTVPPEANRPPLQTLQPQSLFAGRYVIDQQIGIGGMGIVYKATDKFCDKMVAIKLIHPKFLGGEKELERLKQEGVLARDIRHKNVVAVYDVGESEGQVFISMELLEGQSLRSWHRSIRLENKQVPASTAVNIVRQLVMGLQAAHDQGVIHRDLKPENIMVCSGSDELHVKILDFGIAHVKQPGSPTTGSSGTVGYMAPEQITSPDLVGPASDFYAVSVILYELLVDVLPQGHWEPPSYGRQDIPRVLDQIVARGLSNRPSNRFQDSGSFLSVLDDLSAKLSESVAATLVNISNRQAVSIVAKPKNNNSAVFVVLIVLAAVIGLAGLCMFATILAVVEDLPDESFNVDPQYDQYYSQSYCKASGG